MGSTQNLPLNAGRWGRVVTQLSWAWSRPREGDWIIRNAVMYANSSSSKRLPDLHRSSSQCRRGIVQTLKTHLSNHQVLGTCDFRQVSLIDKDLLHAQLREHVFQIIAARDGKLWQVEVIYSSRK